LGMPMLGMCSSIISLLAGLQHHQEPLHENHHCTNAILHHGSSKHALKLVLLVFAEA